MGACLEKQEDYLGAIKLYKKAMEADATCEEAWFGIGVCLSRQEKWYEAIHFLKKAIKINAQGDVYWSELGLAEFYVGNIVSAYEAFARATELNPENPAVWLDWSFAYYEQGMLEEAIATVLRGLEEMADNADMLYRAGAYCLAAGKQNEAYSYIELALYLDYDGHEQLYEFFEETDMQKALYKIISKFRK